MRATCCPCAVLVLAFAASAAAQELTIASADIPSSLSTTQDPQEKPAPPPEGTGWKTLLKDTALDFKAFPQRRSTWVILASGGALALAVHPADDYVESHIVGNDAADKFFAVGKVIGSAYFQAGSAIGLWVVGRYVLPPQPDGSRTNRVSHLGFDLMRAQIITQTLVNGIKVTVRRDRPTGECCAFPSGHAASAFAAASVLERHLGYRASWPALVAATYVATSRLVDNRHFLSDVVFGAAVGEAAGWTVVGRHGRSQYALQPVPIRGGMMVALVRTGN